MSVRIYKPRLTWNPIGQYGGNGEGAALALDAALHAWEGTKYESGQRFIQRGCDCIGGVFGVVDMIDGRPRAQFPGMPADAAMHNRAGAIAAVRELVSRYNPCHKVEADAGGIFQVEPGDIVVTGSPGGGPGHVEIVGAHKNELWHAQPSPGFHQGGWSFLDQQVLFAIYRIEDKWRWSR